MTPDSESEWYYTSNGQQLGPISLGELQARVDAGEVGADELVWREGLPEWVTVQSRGDLFAAVTPAGMPAGAAPLTYAAPVQYLNTQTEYAGFWWRVLASIVDSIITGVGGFVLGAAAGFVIGFAINATGSGQNAALAGEIAGQLIGVVGGWLYFAFMESSSKQATLGKMACGLIVTDLNGNRITFARATGRNFAKYLSSLILGIGYLMVIWTEKRQGLHDQLANCLVLRKTS